MPAPESSDRIPDDDQSLRPRPSSVDEIVTTHWEVRGQSFIASPLDLEPCPEDVALIDGLIADLLAGKLDAEQAQRVRGRIVLFRLWRVRCEVVMALSE